MHRSCGMVIAALDHMMTQLPKSVFDQAKTEVMKRLLAYKHDHFDMKQTCFTCPLNLTASAKFYVSARRQRLDKPHRGQRTPCGPQQGVRILWPNDEVQTAGKVFYQIGSLFQRMPSEW